MMARVTQGSDGNVWEDYLHVTTAAHRNWRKTAPLSRPEKLLNGELGGTAVGPVLMWVCLLLMGLVALPAAVVVWPVRMLRGWVGHD